MFYNYLALLITADTALPGSRGDKGVEGGVDVYIVGSEGVTVYAADGTPCC